MDKITWVPTLPVWGVILTPLQSPPTQPPAFTNEGDTQVNAITVNAKAIDAFSNFILPIITGLVNLSLIVIPLLPLISQALNLQ